MAPDLTTDTRIRSIKYKSLGMRPFEHDHVHSTYCIGTYIGMTCQNAYLARSDYRRLDICPSISIYHTRPRSA